MAGIEGAKISVEDYKETFSSTALGFFTFELKLRKFKIKRPKTFPERLVITVRKKGLFYSIKNVLVTDNIIDQIQHVEIVLFDPPDPVWFYPEDGVVINTTNAARVNVRPKTTFKDENGNVVTGPVNARIKFIDPASAEFEDSPGEFIADGVQLSSLGLFNPSFADPSGAPIFPIGNIGVEHTDPAVKDMRLYKLTRNGQWKELPGGGARRKRQAGGKRFVGEFGPGEVDGWLNIDKPTVQKLCYIKLRVFEDNSFTTPVTDGLAVLYTAEFLLKVQVGSSILGLNLPPTSTNSPGQDCYTARCTDTANIDGEITLFAEETLGTLNSIPIPTIPVPSDYSGIPGELVALNYEVNSGETIAKLKFDSDSDGPLFDDEDICKIAPVEKSLWFARRKPQFSNDGFGDDVCIARVRLHISRFYVFSEVIDSMSAVSVWGTDPSYVAEDVIQANTITKIVLNEKRTFFFACLRFRCSETGGPTSVTFNVLAKSNYEISCSGIGFTPNVIAADGNGYFYGTDENIVRENCKSSMNVFETAYNTACSINQL